MTGNAGTATFLYHTAQGILSAKSQVVANVFVRHACHHFRRKLLALLVLSIMENLSAALQVKHYPTKLI